MGALGLFLTLVTILAIFTWLEGRRTGRIRDEILAYLASIAPMTPTEAALRQRFGLEGMDVLEDMIRVGILEWVRDPAAGIRRCKRR